MLAAFHYMLQPARLLLMLFAASAVCVQLRGRIRLKFRRQLGDHSTVTAPYNLLVYLASRVPNRPFFEPGAFPELQPLTDHWEVFRREGLRLLGERRIGASTGDNDIGFHAFFRRGWKRFYLKWYGEALPSARALCPDSVALLERAASVHGAMFALLPPGARLGPHRDPFAGSLRYHLGLSTPNSNACWIKVDSEIRCWRDGEVLMFDETFVHEARNEADTPRLILFCDVERPLAGPMAPVNRWVIRHVMRASATQNVEGEPIGAINRLYARISGIIRAGKHLKARNRLLYYSIKNAVTVGGAAAMLWPY